MIESASVPTPQFLYKYRALDLPELRRLASIIIDSQLWYSSPQEFNDPFDCFPVIDTSGSHAEQDSWIRRRERRMLRDAPRAERRRFRRFLLEGMRRGLGTLVADDGGMDAWRNTSKQLGVVSLSAKPDDMLMWGHYGQSHTGVCLEFKTDLMPFTAAHPITYSKDRPIFRPLDPDRNDLADRVLLRKADFWSYEEEWRLVRPDKTGSGTFPPEALTAVILGANTSAEAEHAVRALVTQRSNRLELRKCELDRHTFRLNIRNA